MPLKTLKETIIKEFDEKYSGIIVYGYGGKDDKNISDEVKIFILSALDRYQDEIVKIVEKNKLPYDDMSARETNNIISDIIDKLKNI